MASAGVVMKTMTNNTIHNSLPDRAVHAGRHRAVCKSTRIVVTREVRPLTSRKQLAQSATSRRSLDIVDLSRLTNLRRVPPNRTVRAGAFATTVSEAKEQPGRIPSAVTQDASPRGGSLTPFYANGARLSRKSYGSITTNSRTFARPLGWSAKVRQLLPRAMPVQTSKSEQNMCVSGTPREEKKEAIQVNVSSSIEESLQNTHLRSVQLKETTEVCINDPGEKAALIQQEENRIIQSSIDTGPNEYNEPCNAGEDPPAINSDRSKSPIQNAPVKDIQTDTVNNNELPCSTRKPALAGRQSSPATLLDNHQPTVSVTTDIIMKSLKKPPSISRGNGTAAAELPQKSTRSKMNLYSRMSVEAQHAISETRREMELRRQDLSPTSVGSDISENADPGDNNLINDNMPNWLSLGTDPHAKKIGAGGDNHSDKSWGSDVAEFPINNKIDNTTSRKSNFVNSQSRDKNRDIGCHQRNIACLKYNNGKPITTSHRQGASIGGTRTNTTEISTPVATSQSANANLTMSKNFSDRRYSANDSFATKESSSYKNDYRVKRPRTKLPTLSFTARNGPIPEENVIESKYNMSEAHRLSLPGAGLSGIKRNDLIHWQQREQTFEITPPGFDVRYSDIRDQAFANLDDTPEEVKDKAVKKCAEWINRYL